MRKVYTSKDFALVSHLKNLLDAEGILCFIRNQNPFISRWAPLIMSMWPELWIIDDSRYDQAKRIIEEAFSHPTPRGWRWKCPKCGEEHEPQFTECWNCGSSRPDLWGPPKSRSDLLRSSPNRPYPMNDRASPIPPTPQRVFSGGTPSPRERYLGTPSSIAALG